MHTFRPSWSRIGGILVSVMLATAPLHPVIAYAQDTVDKSETVHVNTDASGAVTGITVDELLANGSASSELYDWSSLSDIAPGEEDFSFVAQDDGALTWTTGGKDVSYEGISADTPPVNVTVSYTLDGSPVAPADLAGASGHLQIRVDYENTLSELRTIGGEETRIFTPFVCMTVAILDSEIFRNVTVENGKVIDDKGGLAVIGYAAPGLRESLALDPEEIDLDFPEHLQIEADVSDLVLDPIYTIVTPELLSDLDPDELSFDDLGEGTDELEDAMGQLIDGSGTLADGLHQIADGSGQLGAGAWALREALGQLPSGISKLSTGAHTLSDSLTQASDVAAGLAEGASGLADGADAAQGLVEAAQGSVGSASDSVSGLKEAVGKLGLEDACAAADEASGAAGNAKTAIDTAKGLIDGVAAQAEEQKGVVSGDLDAVQATLEGLLADEGLELTPEQRAVLEGRLATAQEQLAGAHANLDALSTAAPEGLAEQTEALSAASTTLATDAQRMVVPQEDRETAATAADTALGALDGAATSLATANEYLGGVAQGASDVSTGASGIASGLKTAATGATSLAEGLGALESAAPQSLTGVEALAAGSDQLTSALAGAAAGSDTLTGALSTFNDEGITKIVDALSDLDNDLNGTSERLEALRDAARAYDNFAGKADGATGSVRFIYKTEQIG